ncbi:MAG: response regulator [Planctomycetes bacterium]|nr:response regulator [Planctomycetota bacterium]
MEKREVVILIADDDDGHATLIKKNLKRAGLQNEFMRFRDGQETLDFLFGTAQGAKHISGTAYLLLLDIRMPKVDGVGVLKQIKADDELRKIPVIMLTTTGDPREIERCHFYGCSSYVVKPVEYDAFIEAIRRLGLFLTVIACPTINGVS